MPSKVITSRWDLSFQELKQYQQQHGHCNVPPSHVLSDWVASLRKNYQQFLTRTPGQISDSSPLTQNRIDALNDIGFSWLNDGIPGPSKSAKSTERHETSTATFRQREREEPTTCYENKDFPVKNVGIPKKHVAKTQVEFGQLAPLEQLAKLAESMRPVETRRSSATLQIPPRTEPSSSTSTGILPLQPANAFLAPPPQAPHTMLAKHIPNNSKLRTQSKNHTSKLISNILQNKILTQLEIDELSAILHLPIVLKLLEKMIELANKPHTPKSRGVTYMCGRCQVPKKGHVCPFDKNLRGVEFAEGKMPPIPKVSLPPLSNLNPIVKGKSKKNVSNNSPPSVTPLPPAKISASSNDPADSLFCGPLNTVPSFPKGNTTLVANSSKKRSMSPSPSSSNISTTTSKNSPSTVEMSMQTNKKINSSKLLPTSRKRGKKSPQSSNMTTTQPVMAVSREDNMGSPFVSPNASVSQAGPLPSLSPSTASTTLLSVKKRNTKTKPSRLTESLPSNNSSVSPQMTSIRASTHHSSQSSKKCKVTEGKTRPIRHVLLNKKTAGDMVNKDGNENECMEKSHGSDALLLASPPTAPVSSSAALSEKPQLPTATSLVAPIIPLESSNKNSSPKGDPVPSSNIPIKSEASTIIATPPDGEATPPSKEENNSGEVIKSTTFPTSKPVNEHAAFTTSVTMPVTPTASPPSINTTKKNEQTIFRNTLEPCRRSCRLKEKREMRSQC